MKKQLVKSLQVCALVCAPALASAQNHVYNLNNSLSDLYAGPSINADGGTLGPSGYTFGANQGLSLYNVFSEIGRAHV